MTNAEILRIAMEQSAIDLNAAAEDFEKQENVIVLSRERDSSEIRFIILYCLLSKR